MTDEEEPCAPDLRPRYAGPFFGLCLGHDADAEGCPKG